MKNVIQFLLIATSLLLVSVLLHAKNGGKESGSVNFLVRLVNSTPVTPDCGYYAFALAQKFEVLAKETSAKKKLIVILIPCPELQGAGLLKKGVVYSITAVKTVDKSFKILNEYTEENLPTFWAKEIRRK